MKTFKVEEAQSKSNMQVKKECGKITSFPETKPELIEVVNKLNDEQALTLINLLEVQTKVFTRPRLQGRTVPFIEVLSLPRKTNIGKAIADITDKVEQLVIVSGRLMASGDMEGAKANMEEMNALLAKKKQLEELQDKARAKRAAKKAADKAKADSKPKTK